MKSLVVFTDSPNFVNWPIELPVFLYASVRLFTGKRLRSESILFAGNTLL